jgi:phosphotriesterase-related protein
MAVVPRAMNDVETVRGPIDSYQLGRTLMHEHVFVLSADIMQNYGGRWWDEDERLAEAAAELNDLHARGFDTILDLTVMGLGRDIPRIQRLAALTEINIVVATGLYTYDQIPQFFEFRTGKGEPEGLLELFVADLEVGIADSGVKAGMLKCVLEQRGYTTGQRQVHEAVCEAHRRTGASITVHTNARRRNGTAVLDFFAERGVELTKVVLGHSGDSNDLDYLMSLMDRGATIGCDRFGLESLNQTAQRVRTVADLCDRGYADRIVLSQDAASFCDFFSGSETSRTLQETSPNWNYSYLAREVLALMQAEGITAESIDRMLVDNPRRLLDWRQPVGTVRRHPATPD